MTSDRSSSHPSAAPLRDDARRIVIVLPSWVGDVVMATPVMRAARETLPEATIIGAMRSGLEELLAGSPWLDETLLMQPAGLLGPWRLGAAIRRLKPDVGLLLPNSFRSALALRLSGCPVRIGYNRDGRSFLLTHAIAPPPRATPVPAVNYYADLAANALGTTDIDRTLQLHTTPAEREAADELLKSVEGPVVVLNPGANRLDKRWPAERFAAVGDALAASRGATIAVNGSPAEADIVREVIAASLSPQRFINLVERPPGIRLGSLKAVIERAALLITNDTGPRHIAAALGTPIVSLFGPTDHRWTLLADVRERRLLAEPFLPEDLAADDHAKACAIDRIRIADVIAAAEALL